MQPYIFWHHFPTPPHLAFTTSHLPSFSTLHTSMPPSRGRILHELAQHWPLRVHSVHVLLHLFKSDAYSYYIYIFFLYGFAISNVACTYICLPKETMPCCRVARDRDTCYATHGTVYVAPIASHETVLKTDRAERDPSCTGCGNRAG